MKYNKWLVLLIAAPLALVLMLGLVLLIMNVGGRGIYGIVLLIIAFVVSVASINLILKSIFKKKNDE